MAHTLSCPRGHPVGFTDDDRGGDVYCPVCGVACPVPAADAADGAARCRHGHPVPVAADGTPDPYCPTCGVAVDAVAAPAAPRPGRVAAFSAAGAAAAAAGVAGRATCPRCAEAFPFTVAQAGGTAYCPRCGTGVATAEPGAGPRPADTGVTPLRAERRGRSARALAALGLLAAALAGAGYVVWQHPEDVPFVGAALPWNRAAIATSGAGDPPPPTPPPEQPRRPGDHITLAMIDELPRRPDPRAALDDANVWRVTLAGADLPPTDPRPARLGKAIAALEAGVQKKAAAKAKAAVKAAAPDPPPARPRSDKGPDDAVRLLEQARTLATPERATEAMEARARALFLVPRIPQGRFQKGDAGRLKALEEEVTRLILQARGRRAAADAELCLTKGDDEALRRLVADGKDLLPAFAEVNKECGRAYQTIKRLAGERAPQAAGSAFGREVLVRCDYEEAMERVRRAEPAAGVAAAARAHARAPAPRLTEFVFEALDAAVARAADPSADDAERARWAGEARRALDAADPWRADPRWTRLDAALRAAPAGP